MSEISVLSHEYHTASELSDAINRALIALKKKRLGLPGAEQIGPEELERSRAALADIVAALRALLEAGEGLGAARPAARARVPAPAGFGGPTRPAPAGPPPAAALAQQPASFAARLRAEHGGDLPYFLEGLERVAARLQSADGALLAALTEEDLALLEDLAAAAEAEASYVFRRLMRT